MGSVVHASVAGPLIEATDYQAAHVLTLTAADVGADASGAAAAAQAASQPLNAGLTAISGLTTTSFGRGLLTDADAAALRSSAGLGTLATQSGTFSGTSSGTNTGDQTNISGNAATVTTNANLTGDVSSVGNATTIGAGKVTEAMQVLANNTTQNVSTSKHGYAPILPNDATKFLDGTGAYSVPASGSTPSLASVLAVGASANNVPITGINSLTMQPGAGETAAFIGGTSSIGAAGGADAAGNGGAVSFVGGDATQSAAPGGNVVMQGGNGVTGGAGAIITVNGGTDGNPASVELQTNNSTGPGYLLSGGTFLTYTTDVMTQAQTLIRGLGA